MSFPAPPELRVLCWKLTSIPHAQLPAALPSLINLALQCKTALSLPQDQKLRDGSSETSLLVHKLNINIKTLLEGRSREGRFAAIGLVKALVDVGGWETLRCSEPWVRSLLQIVQKSDPTASKELAIIALTKIYLLVQPYQTLVRELATKSLPDFIEACLRLVKPASPGELPNVPLQVVETVCESFSTLIPLYSTIFRPKASQIRTATKAYLAPTSVEGRHVPETLRTAARQLIVSLHHVAAKSGGSEEWSKLIDTLLVAFHATADQVFRAVQESWEPLNGIQRSAVDFDTEVNTGNSKDEYFPSWTGFQAGVERLIGIAEFMADCLQCPSKTSVAIPLTSLVDATSRACLIARLSPKTQSWEQSLEINPAVGREERDELWSALPNIHIAMLQLLGKMIAQLDQDAIPLITESLDQLTRVFVSGISTTAVRQTSYSLLSTILPLSGPNLSRSAIESLDVLIKSCCRDLQEHHGFLKQAEKSVQKPSAADQKKSSIVNADLFLKTKGDDTIDKLATLKQEHATAATTLLVNILTFLPQQYMKPSHRSLLDRTAIVAQSRDAMLASILNPYKDRRGKMYPNILPHFARLFPQDQGLEILRTNLRTEQPREENEVIEVEQDLSDEDTGDHDNHLFENDVKLDARSESGHKHNDPLIVQNIEKKTEITIIKPSAEMDIDRVLPPNPFESVSKANMSATQGPVTTPLSLPKRKLDGDFEQITVKRQETELKMVDLQESQAALVAQKAVGPDDNDGDDDDDDDDESVHLNMELEDDSDTDAE